jgi:hypothetical protein
VPAVLGRHSLKRGLGVFVLKNDVFPFLPGCSELLESEWERYSGIKRGCVDVLAGKPSLEEIRALTILKSDLVFVNDPTSTFGTDGPRFFVFDQVCSELPVLLKAGIMNGLVPVSPLVEVGSKLLKSFSLRTLVLSHLCASRSVVEVLRLHQAQLHRQAVDVHARFECLAGTVSGKVEIVAIAFS